MKDYFVTTKNVMKFHAVMARIHHKLKGVERMALFFGDPGLGKSETALQYAANNGSLYIRMKKLMNARWFLTELADDLGGLQSGEPRISSINAANFFEPEKKRLFSTRWIILPKIQESQRRFAISTISREPR